MNLSLKAASTFTAGALLLTLGYGFVQVGSQEVPVWTKNGTTVSVTPGTTVSTETTKTETLTQGGGTRATSSLVSTTLLVTDIDTENVIEYTPNNLGLTLTLPATTTAGMSSFVPNSSDCRSISIINASSTAGVSFTLAGNTGSLLKKSTSTAAVLSGGTAQLTACRKANTDIQWTMNIAI